MTIACIPADQIGNKLYIKDLRIDKDKVFVKYKSTYNQVPFMEVELNIIDEGKCATINGDDGTVLYRFSTGWLNGIKTE